MSPIASFLIIRKREWVIGGLITVLLFFLGINYFSIKLSSGLIWDEIVGPQRLQSLSLANPAFSVEKRYYIWLLFWDLASQKPFLGSGLENINAVYSQFFIVNKHVLFEINPNPSSVMYMLKDLNIDSAHNYSLDLLISSGVLGFLSYGILICLLINGIKSRMLFLGLLVYLIWSQFQNQSVAHLVYFWLLVGLADQSRDT